ncbi:unnamed protein product, partial [Adineta steineri]
MDTTENNILLSNNDDELEQEESCSSIGEFELMNNKINEKDWSSSDDDNDNDGDDDDDDDDDKEITYHHKESSNFKNLDWHQVPFSTSDITWYSMNRHARREFSDYREKIRSIRRQLAIHNLILRPIYKGIGYYLDSINIFQKKTCKFMTQTNCYSFLFKLSRSYPHASQNRLANIVDRVETTLNNLFHSKSITETQYNLMKINRTSVRMNYLYFVSQTHKEGIPVQPIMICNDGPTEGICRFLGRLLGLLFNDATHCKKFHKAVNVIHE